MNTTTIAIYSMIIITNNKNNAYINKIVSIYNNKQRT